MRFKGIMSRLKNYLAISKELAKIYHQRRIKILSKMISAKLLLNVNVTDFSVSGLIEKSIIQEILFNIKKYFTILKELANNKNRSKLRELCKMVWCKIAYDLNASLYAIYRLDEKNIRQCSEYLSKKGMTSIQRKINPSRYIELVGNKLAFYKRCASNNIPTPDIIAILPAVDKHMLNDIPVIEDKESLSALLSQHDYDMLFFKTIDGTYGIGALSVNLKNGEVYNHYGTKMSLDDIFPYCSGYKKNFIVQEHLTPHKDLKSIMPGPALGTFRLITFLKNNKNELNIPYALMKIPSRGNIIDNFQHGESGNLLCGIDVANGKILNAWGKRKAGFTLLPIERHPETKLEIRGIPVPFWNEIIDLVTRAAKVFPELKTLGWDVAITNKGLFVLEANSRYDIDLNQVTLKRGIKSDIPHLLAA